jgi:hypothetical protein
MAVRRGDDFSISRCATTVRSLELPSAYTRVAIRPSACTAVAGHDLACARSTPAAALSAAARFAVPHPASIAHATSDAAAIGAAIAADGSAGVDRRRAILWRTRGTIDADPKRSLKRR